ncbi:hypothetical protein CRM22_003312 [Opisthorchis felineus]|uniref:Uncharacterized protein n=1 Tax=Opisthorchis felineus TaxID=147828 RepID=A0A4V3SFX7_OPIFE|nr:hypothetical protein CRM22_003312 [Opisthorchis felineus]
MLKINFLFLIFLVKGGNSIPSASDVDETLEICTGRCGKQAYLDCRKKCSTRRYKYRCYGECKDKFGMYEYVNRFWPPPKVCRIG